MSSIATTGLPVALACLLTAGVAWGGDETPDSGDPEHSLHDASEPGGHDDHPHGDGDDHGDGDGHPEGEHDDHAHGEGAAHDHDMELGVAPGLVYLATEGEFTFGLHAHLTFALGESPWALGLGFERLLDEHAHNTAGVVVLYRITSTWSVVVSPGLTFEDEHPGELLPSAHLETAWEFLAVGDFHFGPSLELAIDPEDVHMTLGLHFGLGF